MVWGNEALPAVEGRLKKHWTVLNTEIYGTRWDAPKGHEGAGQCHYEATLSSLKDHGD